MPEFLLGGLYLFAAACHASYAVLSKHAGGGALFTLARHNGPAFFSRGQIVSSFAVLAWLLHISRRNWLRSLLAVYTAGFAVEFIGVRYGIPFGGYRFTPLLGYRLADTVPLLIPLSWFNIAFPSFMLAGLAIPSPARPRRLQKAAFGSFLMLVCDLSLDPVMAHQLPFWVWETHGIFYGIPISNFLGWFITGLLLMLILDFLADVRPSNPEETSWMIAHYGATIWVSLGVALICGLWLSVILTALGLGLAWAFIRFYPTQNRAEARRG